MAPTSGPVEGALEVDVCVIGAGISGLTTAYRCLLEGKSVVVLEKGEVGAGETLRTSAHLASALDDRFSYLEQRHGLEGARLLAESHQAAIDWIEGLCAVENIDCDFGRLPGFLYPTSVGNEFLEKERAAATRAGLSAEIVEAPAFGVGEATPCLRFEHQASIDAGRYLTGLGNLVLKLGAKIHTHSLVTEVHAGSPNRVIVSGGHEVRATHVVVATNAPITSKLSLPLRQFAYRSYVIALTVPEGSIKPGLHWDTEDPYHYVRVARSREPGYELLVVGGQDHKTGQAANPNGCFETLEAWARKRFSKAEAVAFRWSGQIMEPFDGVGFVGVSPGMGPSVYIITGDSGNGLTLGTLGAKIIADAISGRENNWANVYDPKRSVLAALGTLLKETINAGAQYLDYLQPGEISSEDEIPEGEGGILREGLTLRAVYRDTEGICHVRSAVCPHLGAIVHWNTSEKTWDCPAHGSRFDREGRVLAGPATADLNEINLRADKQE